jgi:outer membrane protein TolC
MTARGALPSFAAAGLATVALAIGGTTSVNAQVHPAATGDGREAGVAAAEPRPALSLEEVLASVELHYPLIEVARHEIAMAEGEALAADGAFDPLWRTRVSAFAGGYDYARVDSLVEEPTPLWGASFFVGYRYGRGKIQDYYRELATLRYGEIRAGVQVPLWRNGPIDRRRAGIARAGLGVRAAELGLQLSRIEVMRIATNRYWDWVAAGARLEIARSLLAIAVQRDAQVAARAASGDVAAVERTENARLVVQREGGVVAAERSLQQAAIELSLFYRGSDGRPRIPSSARLPPGIPDPVMPPAEEIRRARELAVARRPDVRRLQMLREQFRVERDLAENQAAPAIDLNLFASQDIGPRETLDQTLYRAHLPQFEVAVTVEVPVLNRVARGRAAAATAGMQRADEQAELARDRIRAEVRDALSALEAARLRVDLARRELDLARQLEAAEWRRFHAGDSTLLVVNLREQATAEARQREVDALIDFQKAMASYRAAIAEGAQGFRGGLRRAAGDDEDL